MASSPWGRLASTAVPAEAGSIGLLGVELSLAGSTRKAGVVAPALSCKTLTVAVRQGADGELSINGIPLRQILAEEAKDEPAAPSGSPWGTGVDDLRVRDVHLTFTNRDGGTARLNIDHLDLRGFRSWEPDQPGTFVLKRRRQRHRRQRFGTARPFAENISANVEFGIDGIALAGVEEYTGPLGFDPTEGTLTLYGRSTLTLSPEGRLEGTADTTLVLANVDAARLGGNETKLDQGSFVVNGHYAVGADGAISFNGGGEAKLNQASSKLADGTVLSLAGATLSLADLDLAVPRRRRAHAVGASRSRHRKAGGGRTCRGRR